MARRGIRHAFAALIPMAVLLLASGCDESLSVEQQIIVQIRELETLIESGERREFMKHVAARFTGQQKSISRDQLNALILYQFNRHRNLRAQLLPIHVTEVSPEVAEASFNALLTGGPGVLPDAGQMYAIKTYWELRDGEWMLTGADWEASDLGVLPEP